MLTPWKSEASTALTRYGFARNDGEVFRASVAPGLGLVEVHRLYRPWPRQDFWDTADQQQWTAAESLILGYRATKPFKARSRSSC